MEKNAVKLAEENCQTDLFFGGKLNEVCGDI